MHYEQVINEIIYNHLIDGVDFMYDVVINESDDIIADHTIASLGGDSLDLVEICMFIEDTIGIEIENDVFAAVETVGDIYQLVSDKINN